MIGARVSWVLLVLPAAACFSPSGGPAGATESTSTSTSMSPSTSTATLTESGPTTSTATTAPQPTSTSEATSTSTSTSTTTPLDPSETTTLDATTTTTTTTTTGDETTDSDATSTSTSMTTSSTSTGPGAECGNGEVELGEECDDGNDVDTDACTSACKLPKCGDHIVHADEECDEVGPNCMGCQRSWMQVFVTSMESNGDLDGLDGADKFCEQRAASAGIQGRFKAWLSTGAQSAANRLHHSTSRPYKRLDGAVVADSWADLTDGTLLNEIDIDETGDSAVQMTGCGACEVWTSSLTNGNGYAEDCNDWNIPAIQIGRVGECSLKDARWTDGCGTVTCALNARLYCLEQGLVP